MKKKIINFDKMKGLIPTIIQDSITKDVYMLGYMNKVALKKTLEEGVVFFWSRSRNMLWKKGETSGNTLRVKNIYIDCDGDTLLISARLNGKNVCHTGNISCFNEELSITKFIV